MTMKQIAPLSLLLLLLPLLCTTCSKEPSGTEWTVTIDTGTSTSGEQITLTNSSADFDAQMKAILVRHMTLTGTGETPRIGLNRLVGNDVPQRMAGVVTGNTRLEVGPYFVTQKPDGRFHLFRGTPEQSEVLVEGAQTLSQVQKSTLFYIREQLSHDHPQLSGPEAW